MAHKVDGIVFMAGPDAKKDANISGATVLDITPTVLALFGLPTAQDMDGRIIEDALQPERDQAGVEGDAAQDLRDRAHRGAKRRASPLPHRR